MVTPNGRESMAPGETLLTLLGKFTHPRQNETDGLADRPRNMLLVVGLIRRLGLIRRPVEI
jgi:hypothetical protein